MTDHGDDGDDDPQLGGLRAMWLSMPDEDPPARGLGELMAAARIKAEEMATPSLWQRIVAMMRRPPVLALATVMVLVAGAVLVGNRHEKLASAPVATQDSANEMAAGRGESTIVPAAPAMDPAAATVPANEAPAAAVEAKPEVVAPGAVRPRGGEVAKKTANKGKAAPTTRPTKKASGGDLFEDDGAADEPTKQEATDERRDVKAPAKSGAKLQIAEPEPPPPEETELRVGGAMPSLESTVADSEGGAAKKQKAGASQLHTQARSAAARKDCPTVKVLAQKILKQDPAYYRANVANDAAITKCVGTAALQ